MPQQQQPLILDTKVRRPQLGPDVVLRQRLVDRFERGLDQSVILVSAPAGYGKSTAVNLWLETASQPYAWLSVDKQDSSLTVFVTYLVAALRTAYPQAGRTISAALSGALNLQPSVLVELFLKELEALGRPLVLVVDDYHLVHDLDVHAFTARLVQGVPAGIHLVLISRSDPPIGLARLRGWGKLAEVRSPDLRFTQDETAELVQRILGDADAITDEIVVLLRERTEGWPVGLRLTGLALREAEDRLDFAQRFAQSSYRPLADYLLNEVLTEIREEQRTLLLRASLLDRFCAPLCEVLAKDTGAQGQSQDLIDRAWQSNLFLVALDSEGVWYRYHHLFGNLLRQHMTRSVPPETLADLHRRASVWFEANDLLEEAIIHALRADDPERAARLVESNINNVLNREEWRLLEHWLGLLPETALQRPALLVVQAYLQHFRFNVGSIDGLLDASVAGLAANTADYSEDEAAQLHSHIHQLRAHRLLRRSPEQRLNHAELAIKILLPEARYARSSAELFYGLALHQTGRTEEGLAFLSTKLMQQIAHPDAWTSQLAVGMLGIHYDEADLASLYATALTLLQMVQVQGRLLGSGWAHFGLGWVHYQRNELDPAAHNFSQGIDVRYAINARAAIDCYIGLALTRQAQGCAEAAMQTATELRQFLAELNLHNLVVAADALDLRLALGREGQAGFGRQWQAPIGFVLEPDAQLASDLMVLPVLTAIEMHLASGTCESLGTAWGLLQHCRRFAESTNSRRRLIEIGALETLYHAALGEEESALSVLGESVRLAEPGGALRLIADAGPGLRPYLQQLRDLGVARTHVARVLTAHLPHETTMAPAASVTARPPLPLLAPADASSDIIEELTLREIEVLRLLAQGLSNKEIAVELTVSVNTVKKHSINIYQKLHVRNRRQAVRLARALGYLPQDR